MKEYYVIFTLPNQPGTGYYKVMANNKHEAKEKFFERRIKYDKIIKVIL
jgi:hypothetical protein